MGRLGYIGIGMLAGWLAGQFTQNRGYGVFADIFLGAMGGMIGYHFCTQDNMLCMLAVAIGSGVAVIWAARAARFAQLRCQQLVLHG